MNKELIKRWGENTAYSAKCHFKSADIKRAWIKSLVVVNILFAIFSLLDLGLPFVAKIFGLVSLVASVLILVYESQEEKSSIKRHMQIGDEYLSLHYELQKLFFKESVTEKESDQILKKLKRMKEKDKPIINQIAKKSAKKAIEEKGEMIKWWE